MSKEYKSMQSAMQEIMNKDWSTLRSEQVSEDFIDESTKAYGDTLNKLERIIRFKKLDKKDRDTLIKIADLLKKEDIEEADTVAGDIAGNPTPLFKKDDEEEVNEALEPGPIEPRTLAGKIITGEVKLLTVYQGNPGGRQTYIVATGKPSIQGAPPDSIYIDATGNRPRGSGLAIGFRLDAVKKALIRRDGSARVELK
jgi:hypothetical protein